MKLYIGGKEVASQTIDSTGVLSKNIQYENTATKEYFRING